MFYDVFPEKNLGLKVSLTLEKYRGEQDDRHDVRLIWPGLHGFPVIASSYKELPPQSVSIVNFFHSKLFDLSDDSDKEYYIWVQDRIVNGWFLKIHQEYKWENNNLPEISSKESNRKHTGIKIFLEWVQRYVKFNYANNTQ